jgi:hypothetical protein
VRISSAVLCAKNSGHSYYHFMFDQLLGCAAIFQMLLKHKDMYVILDTLSPTSSEAYTLLNVSTSRLLSLENNASYSVDRLYFPSYTGCGSTSYGNMQNFEQVMQEMQPRAYTQPANAILVIDRGSQGIHDCVRCLRNHNEVVAGLREAFPTMDIIEFTSSHSLMETVQVFARARVVVAPHGAALTNILFLPRCASVVEIHTFRHQNRTQESTLNYCYMDMAIGLGHSYRGLAAIGWDLANVTAVLEATQELYEAPCEYDGVL